MISLVRVFIIPALAVAAHANTWVGTMMSTCIVDTYYGEGYTTFAELAVEQSDGDSGTFVFDLDGTGIPNPKSIQTTRVQAGQSRSPVQMNPIRPAPQRIELQPTANGITDIRTLDPSRFKLTKPTFGHDANGPFHSLPGGYSLKLDDRVAFEVPSVKYRPLRPGETVEERAARVVGHPLGKLIGRGGMADVYWHPDRPFEVVKVFNPSRSAFAPIPKLDLSNDERMTMEIQRHLMKYNALTRIRSAEGAGARLVPFTLPAMKYTREEIEAGVFRVPFENIPSEKEIRKSIRKMARMKPARDAFEAFRKIVFKHDKDMIKIQQILYGTVLGWGRKPTQAEIHAGASPRALMKIPVGFDTARGYKNYLPVLRHGLIKVLDW